jgi:hypothetical protein
VPAVSMVWWGHWEDDSSQEQGFSWEGRAVSRSSFMGCLQGAQRDTLCLESARACREGLYPLLGSRKGLGRPLRPELQGL